MGVYDESVISEAARRIRRAAPGAIVTVFGSHARDDAGAQSDLDLLVVEPEVANRARESVRLRRTLRGMDLFVDVVVVSASDAERLRGERNHVVATAMREGRVLAA